MMNPSRCKTHRRINALSVVKMMRALQADACTTHELVEVSGLCLVTVRRYVLTLHSEGVAYIEHWEQDRRGTYTTPAYRLGCHKDAVRPKKSQSLRCKEWRARKKHQAVTAALAGVTT